MEQDQAPPPKGGGWEGVEQPTFSTHPALNPEIIKLLPVQRYFTMTNFHLTSSRALESLVSCNILPFLKKI